MKNNVFVNFDVILDAIANVKEVHDVRVVRRPINYVTWNIKNDRVEVYFPVSDRYLKKAALRVTFDVKSLNSQGIKKIVTVIWRFIFYYSIFPFETIKTMLKSGTIEDLIFYLLKNVLFYLDMDEASFILLSENQQSVLRAFSLTKKAQKLLEYKSTARLKRGLSKRVITEKRPIIIKDVYFEDDINPKMVEKARRTVVAYPLTYNGRVLGIVYVNSKKVREVDEKLVMFLKNSFEIISPQLFKMLLNEKYEDTIDKLKLLNKISGVLVKKDKLDDDTLREILNMLKEHLNLLQIAILVPSNNKLIIKAEYGFKIDKEKFSLDIFGRGIVPYVYITGKEYYSPDVKFDDKYFFYDKKVRAEAAFPLYRGKRIMGVLDVTSDRINAFSEKDLSLLESVAGIISLALVRSFAYEKIEKDSFLDPLTGLKNRRALEHDVPELLKEVIYTNSTCAFVLLDLDGFKVFNDTYGHTEGDMVLKEFGKIVIDSIRDYDIAVRYGGDEFLLVLFGMKKGIVESVLERIREGIKKEYPEIDFSYGIACSPEDGVSLEELLKKSDERLYSNKKMKEEQHG